MSNDNEDGEENSPSDEISTPLDVEETPKATIPGAVLVSSLIINQALENFHKGQRKEYDALVQKLNDPSLQSVHLCRFLQAFKRCVSLLTKKCDIFVCTVLKVNWADSDEETAAEFIDFLITLLSAQTFYLKACLRMLTKLFLPNIPKGTEPREVDIAEHEHVFARAHSGLQAILELVPTTPKFLLPVLSEHFPYIKKHKIYQISYTKNLLQITHYLPLLREEILECIINHVTKIDVEIPKHELEEPDEEEVTQFEVDLDSKKVVNEGEIEKQTTEQNEMAETLDALMEMLYIYIKDLCYVNGNYLVDPATELFHQLMAVYEKIILPTHASCHVHFILFFICSLDQTFSNSFLELCWKKIENPNVPAILRQASAAYMASFVARAKFLPLSTVKVCMELLAHWIHGYIDAHDAKCSGPVAAKHGPFYSVCQALFYMFVFRHRALLELEEGHRFSRKLNFERIITSRLNPLKICLPTVTNLFALVTSRHQIVLCYTVIEHNKRSLLPMASIQSSKAVSHLSVFNQLDSFFPFDPYLLRRSGGFIKTLYQEWEGIEEDATDVRDENTKEPESEDEEEYMVYGKTPDIDVPGITLDIPMSISPGFVVSPSEYEAKLHHGVHRVTKRS